MTIETFARIMILLTLGAVAFALMCSESAAGIIISVAVTVVYYYLFFSWRKTDKWIARYDRRLRRLCNTPINH